MWNGWRWASKEERPGPIAKTRKDLLPVWKESYKPASEEDGKRKKSEQECWSRLGIMPATKDVKDDLCPVCLGSIMEETRRST